MNQVTGGTLGLPEFQRDFKWNPKDTVALISSIIKGFPIGSLLTWVPGQIEFGRRNVYLAPELVNSASVSLILDGQQRITSIYLSLIHQDEDEWKLGDKRQSKDPSYWLHLRNFLATPDEPENFITYSRPIFRKKKYSVSRIVDPITRKMANFDECLCLESGYVPLFKVYSSEAQQIDFSKFGLPTELNQAIINLRDKLYQYEIPTIEIDQNTGIDSVAFIFEKVNNSGLALDTFELLNAKLYKHSPVKEECFHLRDLWSETRNANPILDRFGIDPILFIQAISLNKGFTHRLRDISSGKTEGVSGVSCRKKELFQLSGDDITSFWKPITEAIVAVLERLSEGHILGRRWFPYSAAVAPMAVAYLNRPQIKHNLLGERVWMPLTHFYWNTVFLNRYSSSTESLMASDLIAVHAWLYGGKRPDFMPMGDSVELNLHSLGKANSAIYQGIISLIINSGTRAKDWFTGEEINHLLVNDKGVDDHHIFPRKSFKNGDSGIEYVESILNRTLITPKTNQMIGKKKPTAYLSEIFPGSNQKRDEILHGHLVPPFESKLWESFPGFLKWRQEQIKPLLLDATGWKDVRFSEPTDDYLVADEEEEIVHISDKNS
ncbi:MAG: DUF262 domain-containing protein [Bdellovibrionota bacterium]